MFDLGPFDGVVFDCDGVLVDSEPLSLRAWRRALSRFGHDLTEGEFHQFVGSTDRRVAEHFADLLGVPAEALDDANVEAVRVSLADDGLLLFPDTRRLLDALAGRLPIGVGSNSTRWRLDALLRAAGIEERFAVSVAGDEVPEPKPAPWVYRRAIEGLGVAPGRVLVIEDSPTGITGAAAAGAVVVAVDRGMFDRSLLTGASRVVDELA